VSPERTRRPDGNGTVGDPRCRLAVEAPGVESDGGEVGSARSSGVQRGSVALSRGTDVGWARSGGGGRSRAATLAARALDLLEGGDLVGAREVLAQLVAVDLAARGYGNGGRAGGKSGAA